MDTDVVVSAMRSPTGASAALLVSALDGLFVLVANVPLVVEYEATCSLAEHRDAAGLDEKQVGQFLDALAALVDPIPTYFLWRPKLRDAADEMVLEAAVNGQADAIGTFNLRDYGSVPNTFGIEVLKPSEALKRIKQ
ncbi:MAG: PIN domain-containing protein [Methyloglobulus sp.]